MQAQNINGEIVSKAWGIEEVLVNNELYCAKFLYIRQGFQCSLHYHDYKTESFIGFDGLTCVEYYPNNGPKLLTVLSGTRRDRLDLPPHTPHRFWSLKGDSVILEISSHHSDEDVTRLELSRQIGAKEKKGL
jgi:D-lyxose ketol-isomerase